MQDRTAAAGPAALIRLHEMLLFLRAYPCHEAIARWAADMLAGFSKRVAGLDAEAFQAPDVSGIAGTSLTAVFSYEVARRLAERHPGLRIDWEAYEEPDRLGPVLRRFVALLDEDWPVEAHTPFREWMRCNDLHWLLQRIAALPMVAAGCDERDRADLYDSLQLPLYWELKGAEHTRSTVYDPGRFYVHSEPLLRRRDVCLRKAFEAAPLPVERLQTRESAQILDVMLETSAVRYRELYGFTHPDPAHVYRADAGRGMEIFWFGVPPARRLPLRAYHAGMFFKNGVPAGYVEVLSLFDRAEVGFNLYYTFREGESAWIYARLLQLTHQMLGVNTIVVDPYQIGHENDEALDSGAFWFYRKLGFVPVRPEIARMLEGEERRIARAPGRRSTRRTLRKLSAGYIRFDGPRADPGVWDRFRLRNIAFAVQREAAERHGGDPARLKKWAAKRVQRALGQADAGEWGVVLALIPDLGQWTAAEKDSLVKTLRAKRGPEESRYLRLMQRHRRLREAVRAMGSR